MTDAPKEKFIAPTGYLLIAKSFTDNTMVCKSNDVLDGLQISCCVYDRYPLQRQQDI